MDLLMEKENIKLYVDIGELWQDPRLIMEFKNKKKDMTVDSGEMEYLFGEFLINETRLTNEDLKVAEEILEEIADPDSLEKIWSGNATRFVLNKKYMAKMESLDEKI
jgi:hypothetical protein